MPPTSRRRCTVAPAAPCPSRSTSGETESLRVGERRGKGQVSWRRGHGAATSQRGRAGGSPWVSCCSWRGASRPACEPHASLAGYIFRLRDGPLMGCARCCTEARGLAERRPPRATLSSSLDASSSTFRRSTRNGGRSTRPPVLHSRHTCPYCATGCYPVHPHLRGIGWGATQSN